MRYQISGKKYYSTIHASYHWEPNSVIHIDEYIFAHYTNEHSACFILTKGQLINSIKSGGFLLPPRIGKYDMLVTAATDHILQCGMKKLICISHLDDFCLHHLPNIYIGKMGLDGESANREIEMLKNVSETDTVRGPLYDTSTLLEDAGWDKKVRCGPLSDGHYFPDSNKCEAGVVCWLRMRINGGCIDKTGNGSGWDSFRLCHPGKCGGERDEGCSPKFHGSKRSTSWGAL